LQMLIGRWERPFWGGRARRRRGTVPRAADVARIWRREVPPALVVQRVRVLSRGVPWPRSRILGRAVSEVPLRQSGVAGSEGSSRNKKLSGSPP
jgi:hypothetical protein